MLRLALAISQRAGGPLPFQEAHHGLTAIAARGFMFHVQEMPRCLDGAEAALGHMLAKQLGVSDKAVSKWERGVSHS